MSNDVDSRDSAEHHVRRAGRVWWIFAAIALFYLLSEHRAHLFGVLPFLLLLACPVMHFFMHGHHHGHDHDDKGRQP